MSLRWCECCLGDEDGLDRGVRRDATAGLKDDGDAAEAAVLLVEGAGIRDLEVVGVRGGCGGLFTLAPEPTADCCCC